MEPGSRQTGTDAQTFGKKGSYPKGKKGENHSAKRKREYVEGRREKEMTF